MRKLAHILILLITGTLISQTSSAQTNSQEAANVNDSLALVAIYNALDGPNWYSSSNWLNGPVHTWEGVALNGNRVTQLIRSSNYLSGDMPREVGNLTELTFLELKWNQINTIPPEIGSLSNLETLDLGGNNLQQIPPAIGNLSSLRSLNLGLNQLTLIQPEIFTLTTLESLTISNNKINELSAAIGNLTNLQSLNVSYNLLAQLPTETGTLIKLQVIYASHNNLTQIPAGIAFFPDLRLLDLSHNQMTSVPNLGGLPSLQYAALFYNNLDYGDWEDSGLTGDLHWYYFLPQNDFKVSKTVSGGRATLSAARGGLNNSYQWYEKNTLLPDETNPEIIVDETDDGAYIVEVTNPDYPDLDLRSVAEEIGDGGVSNGIMDDEYNALVALFNSTGGSQWTDNRNWMSAEPAQIWHGVTTDGIHIKEINLNKNKLEGSLPPEMGALTHLEQLIVSNNQLNGAIPNEITSSTNLTRIEAQFNRLEDLPDLSPLTGLNALYVQNNRLTFEDIEPNLSLPHLGSNFRYYSQDSIGIRDTVTLGSGDNYLFSIVCGGSANSYQWYKNGTLIPGAESDEYLLSNATIADEGAYHCVVTNSLVPAMPLPSYPIHVQISGTTFEVPFVPGWNWFSANVLSDDMSLGNLLSCVTDADYIKNQTESATYYADFGWYGSLEDAGGLDPVSLYKINAIDPCGISYMGTPVDAASTPIDIVAGWNWIGYLPQCIIPIDDALNALLLEDGDYIKNQTESATYYADFGWYGSLEELTPGEGYMFNKTSADVLVYPECPPASAGAKKTSPADKVLAGSALNPHQFAYSGTVTAKVFVDGAPAGGEDDLIMAYVDDQLRGVMGGIYFEPTQAFEFPLMVYSNQAEGETITFRYYDAGNDRWYPCNETLIFEEDMIVANAIETFDLHVKSAVGLGNQISPETFSLDAYPNPFSDQLHIEYTLVERSRVQIAVYDLLGQVIEFMDERTLDPGSYSLDWNAETHPDGSYLLKLSTEHSSVMKRIILMR